MEKSFPEKVRVDDDWEVGKHDVEEEDDEEEEEDEEEDGDDGAVKTTSSLIGMESSSSSDSLGVVRPGKDDNDVAEVAVNKGAMENVVGRQNEADVDINEEEEEEEGGANEALRG